MATTRAFISGNSQAVRIPAELAYADPSQDLQLSHDRFTAEAEAVAPAAEPRRAA